MFGACVFLLVSKEELSLTESNQQICKGSLIYQIFPQLASNDASGWVGLAVDVKI